MIKYYGQIRTENEFDGKTTGIFATKEEATKAVLELLKQCNGIGYLIKSYK